MGVLAEPNTQEGMRYLQRVVDEVLAVLFDNRRQSCHGLVLNNFVSCSGFKQLLVNFQTACEILFEAAEHQMVVAECEADLAEAKGMVLSDLFVLCCPSSCTCPLHEMLAALHSENRLLNHIR